LTMLDLRMRFLHFCKLLFKVVNIRYVDFILIFIITVVFFAPVLFQNKFPFL